MEAREAARGVAFAANKNPCWSVNIGSHIAFFGGRRQPAPCTDASAGRRNPGPSSHPALWLYWIGCNPRMLLSTLPSIEYVPLDALPY